MSDLPGWTPSESERTGRAPTVRKIWGALALAFGGAFVLALLVDGIRGDFDEMTSGEVARTVLAGGLFGPACLVWSAGLLLMVAARVPLPVLPRVLLWLVAAGAGFFGGSALSYEITGPPPQDMGAAVSSWQALVSAALAVVALAVVALAVATYLSTRDYGVVGSTPSGEPTTRSRTSH